MARGINKCIIVGNLGDDPTIRYMPNGNAVANFTVATSESWKDQQGQMQERTEWHRIVLYNRLAEIAGEFLKKGAKVYLEGKLRTREWQDQQSQKRYTTEIICHEMQMLDRQQQQNGAPATQGQRPQNNAGANKPQQQAQRPQQQHQYQQPQQPQGGYAAAGSQPMQGYDPNYQQPTYNEPPMDFDDDYQYQEGRQ